MKFIPNLLNKRPIPKSIPKELALKIREFSKGRNKELFLKKSFAYIIHRYYGFRANLLLKCNRLLYKDIDSIFYTKGYLHCTNMTYLLRVMIVKSGLFKERDIELKLTTNYFIFLHEYLRIKLSENKYINIDPWAYQFGIDYGDYSTGFKLHRMLPNMNRINSSKIISKE